MQMSEEMLRKIKNAFTTTDVAKLATELKIDSSGNKKEIADRIVDKLNIDYDQFRDKMKSLVWKVEPKIIRTVKPRTPSSRIQTRTPPVRRERSSYNKGQIIRSAYESFKYYRPPSSPFGAQQFFKPKIESGEALFFVKGWGKWEKMPNGTYRLSNEDYDRVVGHFEHWLSLQNWYDPDFVVYKIIVKDGNLQYIISINK